jgi:uncharacterized protein
MLPPRSFDSVKIISLNRDTLLTRLHAIAASIRREHSEVDDIRLFGSLSRDDATGTSDVDILILLRESAAPDPFRRIRTFLPYFDLDRGVDILVYTHSEFDRQLSEPNMFFQKIWRESLVL